MVPDEVVQELQAFRDDLAMKQETRQQDVKNAQAVVDINGPVVEEYQVSLDAIDAIIAKLQTSPTPSPEPSPLAPPTSTPVVAPQVATSSEIGT